MLKYISNNYRMLNIMNMLYRWKILRKYYADVEAQFAEMVSFVWQGKATSVCTKMLFVQTMCSRSLAGKCRMSLRFTVDSVASSLFSSQEHSPSWSLLADWEWAEVLLPFYVCSGLIHYISGSHMTPWGCRHFASFPCTGLSFGTLKVHKNENFFASDFEFGTILLLVMLKY